MKAPDHPAPDHPAPDHPAPDDETMTRRAPWRFHHSRGSAIDFHARAMPTLEAGVAEAWIHHCDRPAIVLGSAQSLDLIDVTAATSAGWEVGRRRSGGGVVVIVPGTHLWVDVVIGPGHERWDDDVHRAFDWIGDAWARALQQRTGAGFDVHTGPLVDRDAGRLLCFAGLGAGEVTIDDAKVVGLSQRRTRQGARFQTMLELCDHRTLLRPFARGALADFLDAGEADPARRRIGLPNDRPDLAPLHDLDATLEALLAQLPVPPVSTT